MSLMRQESLPKRTAHSQLHLKIFASLADGNYHLCILYLGEVGP